MAKSKQAEVSPVKRAGLYIRVSTEEQAMHGYSLDAQRDNLTKYAREHEMHITDYYVDEGKSARKRYTSRPEFMRMLEDVKAGKLDVILFIKLDRWFRNISDYFEIQKVLDEHHVNWLTTMEDYDTSTSSGQLVINLMLSIAQNEADRTSERIKFVFENKIARGEVVTGRVPPGFKIVDKHLTRDPEKAPVIQDLFRHYDEHGSKHGTIQYLYDTYGIKLDRHYFSSMLKNTLYKGEYRGIQDWCEPLVAPELFDRVNARPGIKASPSKRIYIFSGLMICAECGHAMAGRRTASTSGKDLIYYRCNQYSNYKSCTNNKLANEEMIENWLLEHIEDEIKTCIADYQLSGKKSPKPKTDSAAIKRKLEKLKGLYLDDRITLDEYKADHDALTAQLAKLQEPAKPAVNVSALQAFLDSDFKLIYNTLDREKRRSLWHSIIRKIKIDCQHHITILFT